MLLPRQMRVIAEVARQYGDGSLHLTTGRISRYIMWRWSISILRW